jgi:hypothetical protein
MKLYAEDRHPLKSLSFALFVTQGLLQYAAIVSSTDRIPIFRTKVSCLLTMSNFEKHFLEKDI